MIPGILLLFADLQEVLQPTPSGMEIILHGTRLYVMLLLIIHVLYRTKITASLYFFKWLNPVLLWALLVLGEDIYATIQGESSFLHLVVLMLIIVFWNFIFNLSCNHYSSLEKAISYPPLMVMKNGKPLKINMWWGDLDEEKLAKRLEKQGMTDISNSKKVFLQPNGTFVVLNDQFLRLYD